MDCFKDVLDKLYHLIHGDGQNDPSNPNHKTNNSWRSVVYSWRTASHTSQGYRTTTVLKNMYCGLFGQNSWLDNFISGKWVRFTTCLRKTFIPEIFLRLLLNQPTDIHVALWCLSRWNFVRNPLLSLNIQIIYKTLTDWIWMLVKLKSWWTFGYSDDNFYHCRQILDIQYSFSYKLICRRKCISFFQKQKQQNTLFFWSFSINLSRVKKNFSV